ncbi:MAG TPA: hypothetical protein VLE23_05130 [Geminicoccaceae bacterium]|nr:hypothetical protein [Geminicoccaceae bacterium]
MVERTREGRLQIMLDDDELRAVDDWRFQMRMPSRAAAVRELLRLGLGAAGQVAGNGVQSKEFGVLRSAGKNRS